MATIDANGNWTALRGDTFESIIIYKDNLGQPFDVTGWSAKMQVRKAPGQLPVLELSTANGRITLVGLQGKFNLFAAASLMKFPAGHYVYDFETTDLAGKVLTILPLADFCLNEEVTT